MPRGLVAAVLRAILVLSGVVALTFVLLHLAPGDPVEWLAGPAATPAQLAQLRHAAGLDRPLPLQFLAWMGHAVRGDFGNSIAHGEPVRVLIGRAWPATALLVAMSLTLTWVVGALIGAWQANARSTAVDRWLSGVTVALTAMPGYWLALTLVMIFAYLLRWLPAFGAVGIDADLLSPWPRTVDALRHAILPVVTLTLIGVGAAARFTRASMRDIRGASYLVMASAKGVTGRTVTWRHQFRNAMLPVITLLGLSLPAFFSGTVFVEAVFAWPGVGQLMVQGVQARDYPVVMACATISAVLVLIGNLLADGLVWLADPRTRAHHE